MRPYFSRIMRVIVSAVVFLVPAVSSILAGNDFAGECIAPHHVWDGEGPLNLFGNCVAGAGDVDNDGFDDVIIGAHLNSAAGDSAGRAYVYSGRTGALMYTFTGESPLDKFGWKVAGAGDVNRDGYDDLIIGSVYNSTVSYWAGRAYIYSGQDGNLLYVFDAEAERDHFGGSVSGAGDVDGDGYDDVIIGAFLNDAAADRAGRAYVFSGKTGDTLHVFTGGAFFDELGWSVSGAGYVDDDEYADLIVAARFCDSGGVDAGRAYVYSGKTGDVLYIFDGEGAGDHFGTWVSGAGDVNGDTHDDLIVGAPFNDAAGENAGRVYVYSGLNGTLLYTFDGEAPDDQLGWSVSGIGDVDHDGFDDLITGAMVNDGAAWDAGRAYVYSGYDGSLLYAFDGEAQRDNFGLSVSGGDVNNDGTPDLIVGARGHDAAGYNAGRAYVYTCMAPRAVALDIKPGSCPNPLNVKLPGPDWIWFGGDMEDEPDATSNVLAKGKPDIVKYKRSVIPMAIVGTADFDVILIDPESVVLNGEPVLRWSREDVTAPLANNAGDCECHEQGPDGFDDFCMKFDKNAIIQSLGELFDDQVISMAIIGRLQDGTLFRGTDCMVIVGEPENTGALSNTSDIGPIVSIRNYPNPFNASTTISYTLDRECHVRIEVFNALGQMVNILIDDPRTAGSHSITWDGGNAAGHLVSGGVYFYRINADGAIAVRKMLLLK